MLEIFPGLRSLRAFDAAARHLSFSRAANELHVTPAAISHQIKELEGVIGTPLFTRTSRTMSLTRAGEILKAATHESLESLSSALLRIKRIERRKDIRVSATASIAAKWLVPRLNAFLDLVPGADVRLDVSHTPVDFDRDDVDVAIRFGGGNYPGLRSDLLFIDKVFPVCSPKIITKDKPLNTPRDLLKHNLIHLDYQAQGDPWPDWRMWLLAAGIKDFEDKGGLHFGQTSLVLQATIDGHGVALGDSSLVADDIDAGRLVKPFELSLRAPPEFAYHVITRLDTSENPLIEQFRLWCIEQALEMQSRHPSMTN
jgi:LysR family transcriptional regulator, glycine cleavage system transcriptional activator